nr:MAG TPA: hypothetical protein [Caudoviricetes sp.]
MDIGYFVFSLIQGLHDQARGPPRPHVVLWQGVNGWDLLQVYHHEE